MREIKFRAWDKKYKLMIDSESLERDDVYISSTGKVCEVGEWSGYGGGGKTIDDCSEQYVLMQYTGLKDKNGKEIYEGDILADEHTERYVIQWFPSDVRFIAIHDGEFARGVRDDGGEEFGLVWVDCTVIGNIFENPEIITA